MVEPAQRRRCGNTPHVLRLSPGVLLLAVPVCLAWEEAGRYRSIRRKLGVLIRPCFLTAKTRSTWISRGKGCLKPMSLCLFSSSLSPFPPGIPLLASAAYYYLPLAMQDVGFWGRGEMWHGRCRGD